MKAKKPPAALKQSLLPDADPYGFLALDTSRAPTVNYSSLTSYTTTYLSDVGVQYKHNTSPKDDGVNFPEVELPTDSYVYLCLKYGQHFPDIVTEDTPDTINCGHWYNL